MHGEKVGTEVCERLAVLHDVHDVLRAVGQRELGCFDVGGGFVRFDHFAPRLRDGMRRELEDVWSPRVDDLLLAHEHLVVVVVRGDHVRFLGLGRLWFARYFGAAHASLLLRGSEDLVPELVRARPFVIVIVEPSGAALEAIEHVVVAVEVVLDGALEAEVGRLLEHLEEHLLVEIGIFLVVRLVVLGVHRDVRVLVVGLGGSLGGGFGLRRGLLRLVLLLLNLLEVRELGHDHLRGLVLLDVPDVVHGARHLRGDGGLLEGALRGLGGRAAGTATALVRHGAGVRYESEPCGTCVRDARVVASEDRCRCLFLKSTGLNLAGIDYSRVRFLPVLVY